MTRAVRAILCLALASACAGPPGSPGPYGAALDVLADVSEDVPLAFVACRPGEWFPDAVERSLRVLPDAEAAAVREWLADWEHDVELEFHRRDRWSANGLDPGGAFAACLSGDSAWLGFSEQALVRLASEDPAQTTGWLMASQLGVQPLPDGTSATPNAAVAVIDDAVWLGSGGWDAGAAAQGAWLRARITAWGSPPTLGTSAAHRRARAAMPGGSSGALHYAPQRWRAHDVRAGAFSRRWWIPLIESFTAAFGHEQAVVVARTTLDAPSFATLRPADGACAALAHLPRPAVAAFLGATDPVRLLRAIAPARPLEDLEREATRRGGDFDAWRPALQGGFVGIALYGPRQDDDRWRWLVFAQVSDNDAAHQLIAQLVDTQRNRASREDSPPGTALWTRGPTRSGEAIGMRDGTVYAGSAVDAVRAAVRGDAERWSPAIPDDALGGVALWLGGFRPLAAPRLPAELREHCVVARIDAEDGLLVARTRDATPSPTGSWFGDLIAWLACAAVP